MTHMPVTLALALSFAIATAGLTLLLPPAAHSADPRVVRAEAICDGYAMLHVRLASARAAEEFSRDGACLSLMLYEPAAAATHSTDRAAPG